MPTITEGGRGFPSAKDDPAQAATYDYILCGWHTHSEIPLTCVPTSVANESPDIIIQIASGRSPISKAGDGAVAGAAVFEHSVERSLIGIENVADFEVSMGRHIHVWPAADAMQKDIEIFLFGLVWGALCHQRGLLPLHASAIQTKGGIAAFAGHCGAGKSTTAALMDSLGYEVVADDILPVSLNQNSVPGAWPYLRRLKLHRDSIVQLALTPAEPVGQTLDKERCFVGPRRGAVDKWSRLERLYLLEIDPTVSSVSIDQLTGAEAVRTLIDQTYHFRFIAGSGRFRDHLAFCARLASKIPVYRLRRSPSFGIRQLGFLICEHL